MVLLISLAIASGLIFCLKDFIRKHSVIVYLICTALSIGVVVFVWSGLNRRLNDTALIFANILLQGGLAGALFIFVMYAGALSNKSVIRRTVMPIRAQLSIMACILTLGHNIAYGKTYFMYLFTSASSLRINVLLAAICSLIMIAIMLPLFVTSFFKVRRRMQPKNWKRLQRLAYVFYALMYVHVLLLNTTSAREGKFTAILNIALYSLLFLVYASLRLSKAVVQKQHEAWAAPIQLICSALMIVALIFIFIPTEKSEAAAISAEETRAQVTWADGKYKGAAVGYNGRLTVSVVVAEGKISSIICSGNVEDEPYITNAVNAIFPAMIEGNTTDVDAVSSATTTSDALIEAVKEALKKAEVSE